MKTKILSRIRKYFPNAQEVQMEELAALLVNMESEILKEAREKHHDDINKVFAKAFDEGQKLGRELERRNWSGWE